MSVPEITLNNGVKIPQLGLGVFQTPDGAATVDAVLAAIQAGCRHIDTAMIYGNERSVGEGIRRSGIERKEVFVTTKLWNDDVRAGRTREAFEASLERLGTQYVDLYLIHWPAEGWQRAWEQMMGLYERGSIRAIGVSNFKEHHLQDLASISGTNPAVDQVEASPQFGNRQLIDFAAGRRIAIEAWSPLGGTGSSLLADLRLGRIAARYGKSPAQVVIRWHLQRGVIVIPKSTHVERIRENLDVFDFELAPEDMAAISAMDTGERHGSDPDHITF